MRVTTRNTDPAMQQATVNLFADMGNVQPATLMSGLVPATQSTDTTPPTSTITSPSSGATFSDGSAVTISGTATDAGGGVVAGVEVSTDGGTTWHPATTMSAPNTSVTWSYSWIAHGNPTTTIESRAVDDSGNLEKPGPGVTVNVNCPCSIWGTNVTPTTTDSGDPASIEVGVKFKTDASGYITGIRFYKASTNTGTHIGNLWTSTGQLLASATFTNESASGWQQVNFSAPVAVTARTTYVASYFAPNGHYSDDGAYFYTVPQILQPESTVNSAPLHALQNTNGVVNGVYTYSGISTFPTSSNDASNYWVDPVFSATATVAPAVTSVTPSSGATGVAVSVAPTATFSQAVTPGTVSFTVKDSGGNSVAGTVSFNSADTVATFTPSSSLAGSTTYTATVSGAQNASGTPMSGPFSWSFTTGAVAQCPCSIWQDGTPTGAVGLERSERADLGRAVPGEQQRVHHRGAVLQGVRTIPGRIPGACGLRPGRCWPAGTFSSETA